MKTELGPYEYFNNELCIQARFLIDGSDAIQESLRLIGGRGLRKRIAKGYINRVRLNGPNTPMLVSWASLPLSWQKLLIESFGDPIAKYKQTYFENNYCRDVEAYSFYLKYKLPNGQRLPNKGENNIVEEYTINASVLNCVKRVYDNRDTLKSSLSVGINDVWEIVTSECNKLSKKVSHTLPSNPLALRRKLNEYNKKGYEALIHGNWCNSAALKVDKNVIGLLNSMFAYQTDKPTKTEVSRQYDGFLAGNVEVINKETGEAYDPSEFPKLSKNTITNWLSKWANKSATHTIRSGNRQVIMSKFKPYHSLKQPNYSNSIISIDDRQPPFEYEKGKRVWFYNGIDLGSEAITVWVYGTTKEGIIEDFYRQLVRNYTEWGFNLPLELEGEMSLNSRYKETILAPGNMFKYVRIEANNARGKRIEAYYRPLRYGLEKKREGWIARPFALSEPNQAGPSEVPIIPWDTLINGCLKDFETWNNTEHSKRKGKTRWEEFIENQNPNTEPTNWIGFLPYIGWKTETSCNVGQIRLQNQMFLIGDNGRELYSDQLSAIMEQIEGKELDVYWLDANDGSVLKALVYLRKSDRYICEAVAKPTYNRSRAEQTSNDDDSRTRMSKYVASVEGYINSRKRGIDRVKVIDNRKTTLNNKFQIPGNKQISREMPVYDEAEILENPDEFNETLNAISISSKRSLKDRF